MEAFLGKGNLTEEEYKELITLEYVLTHYYTHDCKRDIERYMYLQEKKYLKKKDNTITLTSWLIVLVIVSVYLLLCVLVYFYFVCS